MPGRRTRCSRCSSSWGCTGLCLLQKRIRVFAGSRLHSSTTCTQECEEPLRRRKDTDLEQRWRTFNTSQLADQASRKLATETQWCDGETWVLPPEQNGISVLEPSIGHDALITAQLLATRECANWASAAHLPKKTNTASCVCQCLGSCVLIPAAFQYWGLGLQSVCRFREAAHQSSWADCPATGKSRHTSVADRIGMVLAGNNAP